MRTAGLCQFVVCMKLPPQQLLLYGCALEGELRGGHGEIDDHAPTASAEASALSKTDETMVVKFSFTDFLAQGLRFLSQEVAVPATISTLSADECTLHC